MIKLAENRIETSNFYYDTHYCPENDKNSVIRMDYTIKDEKTGKIVRIGNCPDCGTLLFHNDFDEKNT